MWTRRELIGADKVVFERPSGALTNDAAIAFYKVEIHRPDDGHLPSVAAYYESSLAFDELADSVAPIVDRDDPNDYERSVALFTEISGGPVTTLVKEPLRAIIEACSNETTWNRQSKFISLCSDNQSDLRALLSVVSQHAAWNVAFKHQVFLDGRLKPETDVLMETLYSLAESRFSEAKSLAIASRDDGYDDVLIRLASYLDQQNKLPSAFELYQEIEPTDRYYQVAQEKMNDILMQVLNADQWGLLDDSLTPDEKLTYQQSLFKLAWNAKDYQLASMMFSQLSGNRLGDKMISITHDAEVLVTLATELSALRRENEQLKKQLASKTSFRLFDTVSDPNAPGSSMESSPISR